jgi:5-methylthioadenosine/S-adenosylhomocysteine deaminase
LIFIDLNDVAYLPYNSAVWQLVYTEAGRGVESVMVDGRMMMRDSVVKSIDEDALRREVASLMRHFIADYDAMVKSRRPDSITCWTAPAHVGTGYRNGSVRRPRALTAVKPGIPSAVTCRQ